MSEGQGNQERPITRELLGKENVNTQAQLLGVVTAQGEPIRNRIDRIATQGIGGIEQNLQDTYSEASLTQRKKYQKQQEDSHQPYTQELWAEELNDWLNKLREDHEKPDQAVFLKAIGLGEENNAHQFYEKYLGEKSNIIQFINDIETHATREQIIAHADIIRGLGNTFGYESSEAIEHLLHGVRNIKDNKDGFVATIGGEITISPLLKKLVEDSSEKLADHPHAEHEDKSHHRGAQPPIRNETPPPPTRELTEEFARTDPEGFKVALINRLQQATTHGEQLWRFATTKKGVSLTDITLDLTNSTSSSDGPTHTIKLGVHPSDVDSLKRFLPNGEHFSYERELTYKLMHELSHQVANDLYTDPAYLQLFRQIVVFRSQPDNNGLSPTGSLEDYKKQGPQIQANEDMLELTQLYLTNPEELKRYLQLLTNPQYIAQRKNDKLQLVAPESVDAVFNIIANAVNTKLLHPETTASNLTPQQIANGLLDYQTGEVKQDADVNLTTSYMQLVDKVIEASQSEPARFPKDTPVVVLSEVTRAMIDNIASESNRRNQELAFTIQGGYVAREEGSPPIFIGAFAAPASDFRNAQDLHVPLDPTIQKRTAEALAQQTHIEEVFQQYGKSNRGIAFGALHIHYASLGDRLTATPSGGDYRQGEIWLNGQETNGSANPFWGVVTKTNEGELKMNIVQTYRDAASREVRHKENIPVRFEDEFNQQ